MFNQLKITLFYMKFTIIKKIQNKLQYLCSLNTFLSYFVIKLINFISFLYENILLKIQTFEISLIIFDKMLMLIQKLKLL